jgi:hypothetical protein
MPPVELEKPDTLSYIAIDYVKREILPVVLKKPDTAIYIAVDRIGRSLN